MIPPIIEQRMSHVSRCKRQRVDEVVIVSACLLGLSTRYDGTHCCDEDVVRLARSCLVVPVCPEQLGGLPTPREPADIAAGTGEDVLDGRSGVVDRQGKDVTAHLLRGAAMAAQLADLVGARRAILKEGSPSCGVTRIRRNGEAIPGTGVTTALLGRKGVQVEGVQ